jgi:hypothetical protein
VRPGGSWQRFGKPQFAVLGYRKEIYISGRALDESEGSQCRTTDDHDLKVTAKRPQLIGQRTLPESN